MSGTPEQNGPEPTVKTVWDQSRRKWIKVALHDLGMIFDRGKNPAYEKREESATAGMPTMTEGATGTTTRSIDKNRNRPSVHHS